MKPDLQIEVHKTNTNCNHVTYNGRNLHTYDMDEYFDRRKFRRMMNKHLTSNVHHIRLDIINDLE